MMKKILLTAIIFICFFLFFISWVYAEECSPSCSGIEECQRKIDECTKLLQMSAAATKPHEEKVAELQKDINALESNIDQLTKQIGIKQVEIAKDEGKLTRRQKDLHSQIREFYKKDRQPGTESMLVTLF